MPALKGSPVVLMSDTHCQEAPQGIQQSEVTRTRPGISSLRGPSQNLPGTSRNRSNPAMIGNSSLGEHPKPPQVPQRQPRSSLDATASCLSHTTLVTSDDAQCRIPRELKSPTALSLKRRLSSPRPRRNTDAEPIGLIRALCRCKTTRYHPAVTPGLSPRLSLLLGNPYRTPRQTVPLPGRFPGLQLASSAQQEQPVVTTFG